MATYSLALSSPIQRATLQAAMREALSAIAGVDTVGVETADVAAYANATTYSNSTYVSSAYSNSNAAVADAYNRFNASVGSNSSSTSPPATPPPPTPVFPPASPLVSGLRRKLSDVGVSNRSDGSNASNSSDVTCGFDDQTSATLVIAFAEMTDSFVGGRPAIELMLSNMVLTDISTAGGDECPLFDGRRFGAFVLDSIVDRIVDAPSAPPPSPPAAPPSPSPPLLTPSPSPPAYTAPCQMPELSPMLLSWPAANHSQVLNVVAMACGLEVGMQLVINPRTFTQEVATISGFGSILLATPLVHDHATGEEVIVLLPPSRGGTSRDDDVSAPVGIGVWLGLLGLIVLCLASIGCGLRRYRKKRARSVLPNAELGPLATAPLASLPAPAPPDNVTYVRPTTPRMYLKDATEVTGQDMEMDAAPEAEVGGKMLAQPPPRVGAPPRRSRIEFSILLDS